MKNAAAVVLLLALAGSGGCASPGTSEDFKWSLDVPKTVDKGAEFHLKVTTTKSVESGAEGEVTARAVDGVPYHYQIHWTGGSSAPLRHQAWTGENVKVRARMAVGPATILVTSLNKEGLDVKVLEATIDVK